MIDIEVGRAGSSETVRIRVKEGVRVSIVIVMACNALGISYTRRLGLKRPRNEHKWVPPNWTFPLRHQTRGELFDVGTVPPWLDRYQSNLQTVTLQVRYKGDTRRVEVAVGTYCCHLPVYYFLVVGGRKPGGEWSFVHLDDDGYEEKIEWDCPVEEIVDGVNVISVAPYREQPRGDDGAQHTIAREETFLVGPIHGPQDGPEVTDAFMATTTVELLSDSSNRKLEIAGILSHHDRVPRGRQFTGAPMHVVYASRKLASSGLCWSEMYAGCALEQLQDMSIPNHVRELCDRCFCWCNSLRRVTFGSSSALERIGVSCFWGSDIEEMSIPDGVREMGERC